MHQPSLSLRALAIAAASTCATFAPAVHADELGDLKSQVDVLLKRVADLEQQRAAAAAPQATAGAVTGGATPGSFKLPGSNTSVTIGGYVKLDANYSSRSAGVGTTGDQQLEASSIAVGPNAGANERGQVKLHARQSRLFLKTSTPSSYGELLTYLEYDLFGAPGNESVTNSHGLRVRHAYGSLGKLLAGQTWTTFSDPAAYPETVDFGGPVGTIFTRQAQIRWTDKFQGGTWSIAVENPETVAALADGTSFRADDDRFPDIAGNIHYDTKFGKFTVAALARQLRVDSASAPASRDHKWGGGLGVNGVIPVGRKDDTRFMAYYGNALGRYTQGFFNDAVLRPNGSIELPNQWIANVSYRHFWTDTVRSTLALSALRSANPADTAGAINRAAQSAHLNVIWSPVPQANLGLEVLHARRETQNGQSGSLNRVQASAQYSF